MIETLLGFLANIFSTLFSHFTSKHGEQSETRRRYEDLRREIAAALTMYARFFHNPIDIAQTEGHQLPQDCAEGSRKLRELASQLRALSETMPEKVKDMPITCNEMYEASKYLIGLSNSFTTPYGMARSAEERNGVREYEAELRKLLNISEVRG